MKNPYGIFVVSAAVGSLLFLGLLIWIVKFPRTSKFPRTPPAAALFPSVRWARPLALSHGGKAWVVQTGFSSEKRSGSVYTFRECLTYPADQKGLNALLHPPSPGAGISCPTADEIADLQ